MINIMIDIRHISRCVIQISSQSGLYYMRFRQTISLAPYMSRIYHQLRPKKTRGPDVAPSVSRLIFMRCHDNVQSVTFKSSPECRTDTTIRAGTVYIHQMSHIHCTQPIYLVFAGSTYYSIPSLNKHILGLSS